MFGSLIHFGAIVLHCYVEYDAWSRAAKVVVQLRRASISLFPSQNSDWPFFKSQQSIERDTNPLGRLYQHFIV